MILKKYLFLLFTSIGLFTFSQTELQNLVWHGETLMPIESASVYVQNTTIGTITNKDGKFLLIVPKSSDADTLVVSSIGFKSFKVAVKDFDASEVVYLDPDVAALDEVVLIADTRPKTGNDIVLRAIKELPYTLADSAYMQKGFLRHKERNKKEFRWLIESAITFYDPGFDSLSNDKELKVNVDQVRKSYDLRDVDSVLTYTSYLKNEKDVRLQPKNLDRDTIKTAALIKAIKWNDERINGLETLLHGKLNLVRNVRGAQSVFGEGVLKSHQFELDTVLVENGRKLYKINIAESQDHVDLNTVGVYNNGFHPKGWIYIYWDNYAIKKIEYELHAASNTQRVRSKTLFDTFLNHKLVITYKEHLDKMYLNYIYYETPKLVNVGVAKDDPRTEIDESAVNKEERYYSTIQEILFSEVILEKEAIDKKMAAPWDSDIFEPKPYDTSFWKSYNTLLESEEEEKLIRDLTKRYALFKETDN